MIGRSAFASLAAIVLTSCQTLPQVTHNGPVMALTFDDLPVHGEAPAGATASTTVATIVAVLAKQGVPAHGFANGHWTVQDPPSGAALRQWIAGGLPLAKHGWSHLKLDVISVAEFEQELVRNEAVLDKPANPDWRWFRFPFLAEGEDVAKRIAARTVLAKHGYLIAAVTMDFSDWQWTAPYARCTARRDSAAIIQLEERYLDAAHDSVVRSRQLAKSLYGGNIPYVLLLHGGGMTAHMLPRLLDLYRGEGFRFVTLGKAQRHPIYRADVDPSLAPGPTSLEQRANTARIPVPERTDHGPALAALCQVPISAG